MTTTLHSKEELILETRPCGKCKHFQINDNANVLGYCKEKLMHVTKTMFIGFKKCEGTCFKYIDTFK